MYGSTREIRGCRHGLPQKGGCDVGSHPETREALCDHVLRRDGEAEVGNRRAEPSGGPTGIGGPDVGAAQRQVPAVAPEDHGGDLRRQEAGGLSGGSATTWPLEAIYGQFV